MKGQRRFLLSIVPLLAAMAFALALGGVPPQAIGAPVRAKTVVSLTFDDGQSSQYTVLPTLRKHGMQATFYINSGLPGSGPFYMSWQQILNLANAGNEIGGHTVHHADLSQVTEATARSEICQDRVNLIEHGGLAPITSFAYPRAAQRRTSDAVKNCGYSSARGAGTLTGIAESIPPRNPYRIRTFEGARSSTTLQHLKQRVLRAERRDGGWVVLVFHGICEDLCTGEFSVTPKLFADLLAWLELRESRGTVVRTVGDVIANGVSSSADGPGTTVTCNNADCSQTTSTTADVEVTMRVAAAGGGQTATYYTTDGTDPRTSPSWRLYTGPFTVSEPTTLSYYSRDAAGMNEPVQTQRLLMGVVDGAWSDAGQAEGSASRGDTLAFLSLAVALMSAGGFGVLLWWQRRRLRWR